MTSAIVPVSILAAWQGGYLNFGPGGDAAHRKKQAPQGDPAEPASRRSR